MKINSFILYTGILLTFGLMSCQKNIVLAPEGTVPLRKDLPTEVFGGYITVQTTDPMLKYSGELIGVRNDSLFILNEQIIGIKIAEINYGRIFIYSPNNHLSGLLFLIPNLLLFGANCEDCSGKLPLILSFSALNLLGFSIANSTEMAKTNYIDWKGDWQEIVIYSRFPYEIPEDLDLAELQPRNNDLK
ncbi:hypothetical protein GCM10028791_35290 [Echinicola sediminis]